MDDNNKKMIKKLANEIVFSLKKENAIPSVVYTNATLVALSDVFEHIDLTIMVSKSMLDSRVKKSVISDLMSKIRSPNTDIIAENIKYLVSIWSDKKPMVIPIISSKKLVKKSTIAKKLVKPLVNKEINIEYKKSKRMTP